MVKVMSFSSPHSTILFLRKLLSCFGYGIFWDIAVRTIARCILCEYLSISLSTKWDKSRGTPPPLGTKAYVFDSNSVTPRLMISYFYCPRPAGATSCAHCNSIGHYEIMSTLKINNAFNFQLRPDLEDV